MFLPLCFLLFITVAYIMYKYAQKFHYWKKLGVPSMSPNDQRRLNWDLFTKKRALHDIKKEEYQMFDGERFYGTFDGARKIFVVRDDFYLLRSIMIKDFDHFSKAQGSIFKNLYPANRVEQIINKLIFVIDGDEWKTVR